MDQPYSKRELDTAFNTIAEHLKSQDTVLAEIKADGKETKAQAQKTNGRVTRLEDWSIEAKKLIEGSAKLISTVDKDYSKSKVRMWTALTVLVFCGATIVTLSVIAVKSFIRQEVQTGFSTIEKKYNINVDN